MGNYLFFCRRGGSTADPGTPSLADINRSSRDTNALQLWARQTDGSGMARRRGGERRAEGAGCTTVTRLPTCIDGKNPGLVLFNTVCSVVGETAWLEIKK